MVLFCIEKIMKLMEDADKARIFSIIASTGSDLSTFADHLISRAEIVVDRYPNSQFTDIRIDEPERRITVLQKHNSMLYYEANSEETKQNYDYVLNLVHLTPRDLFPIQISDSLRIIDGLLVLVNCQEYLSAEAEVTLRQAMREKIKPIIIVGNLEKNILDLQQDAETIYQHALKVISQVNIVTSSYQHPDMGDLRVSPEEGNVAFVSEKYGWGFTLRTFAKFYVKKLGLEADSLMLKLWGDNYFDPVNKKWLTQSQTEDGRTLTRGFVQFIMNPIIELTRSTMTGDLQQLDTILDKLEIKISKEVRSLKSDSLIKQVLSSWINVADCVLEMAVIHLSSPKVAQKYRTSCLYEGPQDDVCAQAMRECNPQGTLMVYISQLIPCHNANRLYAMGRVFSGTIESGKKVRIMAQDYGQGKKEGLAIKSLSAVCIASSRYLENVSNISSGNIVFLAGIDQHLMKSGTISDCEEAHKIRSAHCSLSPVIKAAVQPKNIADLPKLIDSLRRLSKLDPIAQIEHAETGEHFIAGCHHLHLEMCLKSLQEGYNSCEIKQSEFLVNYKESISQTSQLCMAKSPNKHNRLYCTAQPLSEDLCQAIEKFQIGPKDDPVLRSHRLSTEFGWDAEDANQIWTFGPGNLGPNVLVNMTTGPHFINEIKDSCEASFQWASKEGVLCEENLRQFRANIVDVSLHSDAIHRGGGQIIPTARRVFYACQLTAQPRLQEPIYLVEITSTKEALSQVYECLAQKRGTILEEKSIEATPIQLIRCHLPVVESIGFINHLASITRGGAYANIMTSHWVEIEEDPLDISSDAFKIMSKIRIRKGLRETPQDLVNYMDNLSL